MNILYCANGGARNLDCCRRSYCRHVLIQDVGNGRAAVENQRGVSVVRDIKFFEDLVKPEHRVDFLTLSRLDCAIVGNKGKVLEELGLELTASTASARGRLTDLVRPRELSNYEQFYRSSICSSDKKAAPSLPEQPHLTIFESSSGFLKWGETFPGIHHMVILDRTEPHFTAAMDTLQNRFLNRLPDGTGPLNIRNRPAGTEVLVFAETSND
ncbi:MAG TPA: hypothetical protein VN673_06245 [Clostridia bacterium]|nr:hypothetical protein [Clostridia bacterium]